MGQLSSVMHAVLNARSNELLGPQVTKVLCSRELLKRVFRWHESVTPKLAKFISIVYVIESEAYGVVFTSCLCQKPERVKAFDTNNAN